MTKPNTITVELTVEQAYALISTSCEAHTWDAYKAADSAVIRALSQHRRQQKRDALGLPWRVSELVMGGAHAGYRVLCRDGSTIADRIGLAASKYLVAGTKALELLEQATDETRSTAWPEFVRDAKDILKKAGWL